MNWYKGKEFEALSLRYQDHVELLRHMSDQDKKWYILSLTAQLLIGAWLIENQSAIDAIVIKLGVLMIDVALMSIGLRMLYLNYVRRCEAVRTLKNIMEALGFTEKGIYLEERSVNPSPSEFLPDSLRTERVLRDGFRPWWPYYKWGTTVSIVGLAFLVFCREITSLIT